MFSRLIKSGVHTEYAGPGRVWFASFFGGAGYCVPLVRGRGRDGKPLDAPGWRPNISITGFSLYIRLRASRTRPHWGAPVSGVRLTRNPNRPIC